MVFRKIIIFAFFIGSLIFPIDSLTARAEKDTSLLVKLRILETTDLHAHILPYDYDKQAPTLEFGLAKTATLIKQTRAEVPETNSMLFDVGDTIQGSPLADYFAKVNKLKDGKVHPVIKAMNALHYDAATLGNHEFHYGMDFLNSTIAKARFPYVNANIYRLDDDTDDSNDKNMFTPYVILKKKVKDENGHLHTVKVGVIGFAPPKVSGKDYLAGKAKAKDIVQTANKFIPEMKMRGANLIIALAHSGLDAAADGVVNAENAVYPLSKVAGIDAILFGHKHVTFPGAVEFNNIPGIDPVKGTINGIPSVEAGFWGNHLGMIDLTLENKNGKWKVKDSQSTNKPIFKIENGQQISLAEADQQIIEESLNESQ